MRVLLVGATGLVGRHVFAAAQSLPWLRLVVLSRRPVPDQPASDEVIVAPVAQWPAIIGDVAPAGVICALGTTWRNAGGSERAFRSVDQDLVLAVAKATRRAGAARLVMVSSVGADPAARSFYLRVKGKVETALGQLEFARLDIMRPGLLRGERGGDRRALERLAVAASPLTDRLLHAGLARYRSIPATVVAEAALQAMREPGVGRFVHENGSIHALADKLSRP